MSAAGMRSRINIGASSERMGGTATLFRGGVLRNVHRLDFIGIGRIGFQVCIRVGWVDKDTRQVHAVFLQAIRKTPER